MPPTTRAAAALEAGDGAPRRTSAAAAAAVAAHDGPQPAPRTETLHLRVLDVYANCAINVRITATTALARLMAAVRERRGVDERVEVARLVFDGSTVRAHDTPAGLSMRDGDVIDLLRWRRHRRRRSTR